MQDFTDEDYPQLTKKDFRVIWEKDINIFSIYECYYQEDDLDDPKMIDDFPYLLESSSIQQLQENIKLISQATTKKTIITTDITQIPHKRLTF